MNRYYFVSVEAAEAFLTEEHFAAWNTLRESMFLESFTRTQAVNRVTNMRAREFDALKNRIERWIEVHV